MAVILIVEDEIQIRVLIQCFFEDSGYETLTAATVAEALAIIHSDKRIDLLFTDISLAEQSDGGLQVGLAAGQSRPGLPILYASGRGVTDGMTALFAKPNAFVSKPYSTDQIIRATVELLRRTSDQTVA
jgi:CheY-like chemotaxis protein